MLTQHGIPYAGESCWARGLSAWGPVAGAALMALAVLAETTSSEHGGLRTPTDGTAEQLRGDPGLRGDTL